MTDSLAGETLVIATHNPGKLREIVALIEPFGVEVVAAAELGLPEPEETGASFAENAALKAHAAAAGAGHPALADDSGLAVAALGGAPGIHSARSGGPAAAPDRARYEWLLRELDGVPRARRTARFRTLVVLSLPAGQTFAREGLLEGRIAETPRGQGGFGYDPVFELPDGRTLAGIGEQKQALSHRALAIHAMIEVLKGLA